MDSTVKSNLSVGLPLDMICYRRDSLRIDRQIHISASDTYFNQIRRHWGERLREVFAELPAPDWQ
jgi:putative proteasome-type protease